MLNAVIWDEKATPLGEAYGAGGCVDGLKETGLAQPSK